MWSLIILGSLLEPTLGMKVISPLTVFGIIFYQTSKVFVTQYNFSTLVVGAEGDLDFNGITFKVGFGLLFAMQF